jgi:KDO2-lipid IV(A) lauroyltransferase
MLYRLVLLLLKPLTWLNLNQQKHLGHFLGRHLLPKLQQMTAVTKTNIKLCFPNYTKLQQQQLLQQHFAALGISGLTMLNLLWPRNNFLSQFNLKINNLEYLTDTMRQKRGVILLFPHLLDMYLAGFLFAKTTNIPIALMYHRPRHKFLGNFLHQRLNIHCDKVFTRKDVKHMIKYLSNGGIVWYAPDLDLGHKRSVFVPFFNIPAATLTATARIAQLSQAAVLPIGFYREETNIFSINIHPKLENFPSLNAIADATLINQTVERLILPYPEQYLWLYKRFSTRPQGESNFY